MRTFFFALALTTTPLSRRTSEGPAQAERNQWGLGPSKSHELEWMQMNYSELLTLQAFMAQGTNLPELPRTLLGHPRLNRSSPPHQQPTHNSHTNAPNPHERNSDATRPNPTTPTHSPKPKTAPSEPCPVSASPPKAPENYTHGDHAPQHRTTLPAWKERV